jgi:hypothetical protein
VIVLGLAQLFRPRTSHRMRIVWPSFGQEARWVLGLGGVCSFVEGGGGVVVAARVTLRWITEGLSRSLSSKGCTVLFVKVAHNPNLFLRYNGG